jgi:hypothetical protein
MKNKLIIQLRKYNTEYMKFIFTALAVTLLFGKVYSQNPTTFADHWQYVGIAVEEPGYVV